MQNWWKKASILKKEKMVISVFEYFMSTLFWGILKIEESDYKKKLTVFFSNIKIQNVKKYKQIY